jgi:hypothetical protein
MSMKNVCRIEGLLGGVVIAQELGPDLIDGDG